VLRIITAIKREKLEKLANVMHCNLKAARRRGRRSPLIEACNVIIYTFICNNSTTSPSY